MRLLEGACERQRKKTREIEREGEPKGFRVQGFREIKCKKLPGVGIQPTKPYSPNSTTLSLSPPSYTPKPEAPATPTLNPKP